MNLPTEVFGSVAVVHAPDELGGDLVERLQEFLCGLERHNIVLDLDNAESVDSAGLTMLVDVWDALRGQGGDLKIATTNSVNRKILEITRLDQQLEVFDSVVDAVKSFQ